jgi:hypothetical protein
MNKNTMNERKIMKSNRNNKKLFLGKKTIAHLSKSTLASLQAGNTDQTSKRICPTIIINKTSDRNDCNNPGYEYFRAGC